MLSLKLCLSEVSNSPTKTRILATSRQCRPRAYICLYKATCMSQSTDVVVEDDHISGLRHSFIETYIGPRPTLPGRSQDFCFGGAHFG